MSPSVAVKMTSAESMGKFTQTTCSTCWRCMEIHCCISGLSAYFPFSEMSPKLKLSRGDEGNIIYEVFQQNYSQLLDEIDPEEAARHLYGAKIINDSEHELAMEHSTSRRDRSSSLLLKLFRKLRANPQLCGITIVALRNAGTKMDSIIVALKEGGVNVELKSKEKE